MILLPRGNPVKENVNPAKVNLPDALRQLKEGTFSGYLRFDSAAGTGVIIFLKGGMVSALFETQGGGLVGQAALNRIFDLAVRGDSLLHIYRLSPELAESIQALLHGEILYKAQELKLIDIRALLGKLKEEAFSGCLRIYTADRVALIFYRGGNALGFFHDGSVDIETTADTSMSVAKLPGAKVDVLSVRMSDGGPAADLSESIDLMALWQQTRERIAEEKKSSEEAATPSKKDLKDKALALLKERGGQRLGKVGTNLVEKEFLKAFPEGAPLAGPGLVRLFEALQKSAKMLAGPSAINAMLEEMKQDIRSLMK